jgi:transcription elongation factor Elf1
MPDNPVPRSATCRKCGKTAFVKVDDRDNPGIFECPECGERQPIPVQPSADQGSRPDAG